MVQVADGLTGHEEDPWERCVPWLQAALARDPTHTIDQVRDLCLRHPDSFQFWPGARCAVVTQIVTNPLQCDLHIWLAGGDLEELRDGLPSLDAFAVTMGCTRVTTFARKGFERALAPYGYRFQFVALAKDLRHGLQEDHHGQPVHRQLH